MIDTRHYGKQYKRRGYRIRPVIKWLIVVIAAALVCTAVVIAYKFISKAKPQSQISSSGKVTSTSPSKTASSSSSVVSSSAPASSQPSKPSGSSVSGSASSLPQAPDSAYKYFDDAVFMGDSVTVDFLNYDEIGKATVDAAIGVSAYRAITDHKVAINGNDNDKAWMPDRAAAAKPKKVYMMFGLNDLCWGDQMTTSKFIKYYSQLVDAVQSRCPGAKIYIQSILPITKAAEFKKGWPFDNAKINTFNAALKNMCAQKGLKYLDVASVIKGPDGKLPSNVSDDGLHLKAKEYKIWFNYLLANE